MDVGDYERFVKPPITIDDREEDTYPTRILFSKGMTPDLLDHT